MLGIRRRLRDAVRTATDAALLAGSARAPAAKRDRYWARHKRARRRLDRYAEPVVRDHTRRCGGTRGHGNGNTSANARGRGGSERGEGCPHPTAAGPARRVDIASHPTAPLPTLVRRLRRPARRLKTRGPARFPEERGDAALARSRRARDRRPQPREGRGWRVVGPPPGSFWQQAGTWRPSR